MAVQTEEKKLKVKKGKISNGLKEEATSKPVSLDFVGEHSKDAPLTKLEVSQMKEALMAFKKLVELHDSEEVKKKDLLGSACGEGRKVQVWRAHNIKGSPYLHPGSDIITDCGG